MIGGGGGTAIPALLRALSEGAKSSTYLVP